MILGILKGFNRPFAVQLDRQGQLFVADLISNQVHVFDSNVQPIGFLSTAGFVNERPASPGFIGPHSIAFDDEERLYLACYYQKAVFRFSNDLRTCTRLLSREDDLPLDFLLSGPPNLSISPRGELLIADFDSHSLQKFTLDGEFLGWMGMKENGVPTEGWSQSGRPIKSSKPGGFHKPHDLCFDDDGQLYVVDAHNNRVQRYTDEINLTGTLGILEDGTALQFESAPQWVKQKLAQTKNEKSFWPISIENQEDELFIVECRNSRMHIFKTSGEWVDTLNGKLFDYPYDCKVRGKILYIADSRHKCVHIIEREG